MILEIFNSKYFNGPTFLLRLVYCDGRVDGRISKAKMKLHIDTKSGELTAKNLREDRVELDEILDRFPEQKPLDTTK